MIVRVVDYGTGEYRQKLLSRFPPYTANLRRLTDDQGVWLYEIVSWPGQDTASGSAPVDHSR